MRNAETKGYVSWADVMQAWNWYERGYNVKIELRSICNCPVGHQRTTMALAWFVFDPDGELVPLERPVSRRFPTSGRETMPGTLLGLLYELDAALSSVRLWTEPTFGHPPGVERPIVR